VTAAHAAAVTASVVRHERNAEATKRRLLVAAEIEFAAKGFDGARLGNIARAAGVQQALIHHYFGDKEGLYREVLGRGLAAVTGQGWDILARLGETVKGKRSTIDELATAFVDMLVRFYATHRALLAILRHEADGPGNDAGGGQAIDELLRGTVRPMFEAVVAQIEKMKRRGEVRRDVNARHLCVSVMAMACFPFQEERLLSAIWPVDWSDPAFLEERKSEILETVLSRARPA
jgi:TetR/AcrR family transcriptional regulator